ncbi:MULTISPECIES: Cys-tRNA(Pro) deacylase [Enterococcus]|jgi:Cys-tRNA(Pro)/Cys-tRNA(Cys) deacylase|uniref:Cys-tRNA(Pro)/Cys-tRNA(Cys) deacylase n=1 Tax=Enterococcus cecorum TaxID=44008 RepID=A0A366SNV6_9ENTE|nr:MULTISPECIES: Cys-tRNA(Pro) deacylase [Enterococcus]MDK2844372.1 Cys-tRNA(Pro)/Cys-tRNA(Cys) deacylase [Enterococcus sp.]NLL31754.1 Cys-tRNA(Pro) deacylase [Enterococcus cecorum]RBR29431.1 Cys-tRNA(Pro) deacylase [Enterococcus cecorum]RBR29797.1 Cys-tRNA(Pro) deacylase [Enterococcus cecorum]RBR34418.1 Cys-tRNA(Pro) deacylase [Enterococcus cecorum]
MAKKKQVKTNAIRIVEQKKIPYQEHTYTFSENDLGAKHVAEELNQNEAQIFKTLVAVGNKTGPVVAVIPSNQELDLKKIAKESGNKKVEMLHLRDLENLTGYIRGGCSPVGMKKLFPTYFDQSALNFATIMVSAGKRGLQMELAPNDLAGLVRGKFVDLTLEK